MKTKCMSCGGSMKKMQMGGAMGIVGMPKYSNDPRTDAGRTLKKGGAITKAKFGASVNVKHNPPKGMRHNTDHTGLVSVAKAKKGGMVKGKKSC